MMRSRLGGITALAGAVLIAASCASADPSRPARARGVVVRTATNSLGTYLTDARGRALYIWVADGKGKSNCYGPCSKAWPPLITKGPPKAAGGAVGADLGTTTRADGRRQVTYAGRPLYYYAGDVRPGTVRGNGSDQFGARWWVISPSGGWVGRRR